MAIPKNKEKLKERSKAYYSKPKNKEKVKKTQKKYLSLSSTKEKRKEYYRLYCKDPINKSNRDNYIDEYYKDTINLERRRKYIKEYAARPEVIKRRQKTYAIWANRPEVRDRRNAAQRSRNSTEIGKIKSSLRLTNSRIRNIANGYNITSSLNIGCNEAHVVEWLKLTAYMRYGDTNFNIDNYHIDHICPLHRFDLKNYPEREIIAKHWTNLQCLLPGDNLKKGTRNMFIEYLTEDYRQFISDPTVVLMPVVL